MKKIKYYFFVIILCILLAYVTNINAIPESVILFEGENFNFPSILGVSIKKQESMQASSDLSTDDIEYAKKENYEVTLLNSITLKTVEANVIPKTKIIPIGSTVGLKLHTNGVLVVGMSEIKDINNIKTKPYENTEIKEGDMIIEVNGTPITSTNDLIKTVNLSNGNDVNIKYVRDEEILNDNITPIKTSETEYKLGLWVRDTAAGIGTISFYDPESKKFAALRTWNIGYRY